MDKMVSKEKKVKTDMMVIQDFQEKKVSVEKMVSLVTMEIQVPLDRQVCYMTLYSLQGFGGFLFMHPKLLAWDQKLVPF